MSTFREPSHSLLPPNIISLGAKDAVMTGTQNLFLKGGLGREKGL